MNDNVLKLFKDNDKPYDRIKFKFSTGQYHIYEIPSTYDLEPIRLDIFEYLELAREMLEIDDSVELEYSRALRVGEDEVVD